MGLAGRGSIRNTAPHSIIAPFIRHSWARYARLLLPPLPCSLRFSSAMGSFEACPQVLLGIPSPLISRSRAFLSHTYPHSLSLLPFPASSPRLVVRPRDAAVVLWGECISLFALVQMRERRKQNNKYRSYFCYAKYSLSLSLSSPPCGFSSLSNLALYPGIDNDADVLIRARFRTHSGIVLCCGCVVSRG